MQKLKIDFFNTNLLVLALSHKYENCVLIDMFLTVIALGYNSIAKKNPQIFYDIEMSKHTKHTPLGTF